VENYFGIDIDMNMLIKGIDKYSIENNYIFHHCDLNKNWNFNKKYIFDIVICNFSLMHFNSKIFWEQLNNITKINTIMILNIVKKNINFKFNNTYMYSDTKKCKYYFEWIHNKEIEEDIIDEKIFTLNKWKIINEYENNNDNFTKCYKWLILLKI
jgi:hypothetical protein